MVRPVTLESLEWLKEAVDVISADDRPAVGDREDGAAGLGSRRVPYRLQQRGLTLVLVTHDTTIACRAQRVAMMTDGHLTIRQDARHTPGAGRTREVS